MFVLPENVGGPESHGIMDAASMAEAIVHNEEGIGKGNKLVTGQIAIAWERIKTYLAVQ